MEPLIAISTGVVLLSMVAIKRKKRKRKTSETYYAANDGGPGIGDVSFGGSCGCDCCCGGRH